ncbi:cytidine deaminase [Robertkochia aurantiaca]|uniref:cytidine deaminase n=1 Tax=Robertkochia aurantiaca TaxID=2873700 RepID=UPI001CCE7B3A|nr:cytidine deaminase [Robertkochia sp. 3YJGBD-33]
MKKITITSELTVFGSVEEVPQQDRELIVRAMTVRDSAYAPYSRFKVGAALRTASGAVVVGSNQENASYPSGLCAERVAVYQAGAQYPDDPIEAIAIAARSELRIVSQPVPPCGACRQAIAEYESKQGSPIRIYFTGETGEVMMTPDLQSILPLVFNRKSLDEL